MAWKLGPHARRRPAEHQCSQKDADQPLHAVIFALFPGQFWAFDAAGVRHYLAPVQCSPASSRPKAPSIALRHAAASSASDTRLVIRGELGPEALALGESIAVDGVCLTVAVDREARPRLLRLRGRRVRRDAREDHHRRPEDRRARQPRARDAARRAHGRPHRERPRRRRRHASPRRRRWAAP